MRGTDLTEWQLEAAKKFLMDQSNIEESASLDQQITMTFADLIRVVAWYGQIRAEGVARGIPADTPGHTVTISDSHL